MDGKLAFAAWLCLLPALTGCAAEVMEWNGKTEYYAQVCMTIDPMDMYEYVGAEDYVFVGTVEETIKNVISEKGESDEEYSVYKIRIDKNLKGELAESVVCVKQGGLRKDGTMLLLSSGEKRDTCLPETGKQYIFMANAQPDGSLLLSEFFDDRPYSGELLREYLEYCENEIPSDGEHAVTDIGMGEEE